MEILKPSEENIRRAGEALARGLLVAIPTETVYGLGASAFDVRAVARVFEAKNRPVFDPLIVHVDSLEMVDRVATIPSPRVRALMEGLWPGPLTLILPRREAVPDLVTSGLPTVAVRLPANAIARAVIAAAGLPVAAPSANPFGYLSPTLPEHVARMLGGRVDFIVDGGACPIGVESTILDATKEPFTVLRPGGMALEAIEELAGPVEVFNRSVARPTSPGQLPSHYAPRTPLYLFPSGGLAEARPAGRAAALLFEPASLAALERSGRAAAFAELRVLAPGGTALEAAAALFAVLHELDGGGFDAICAERLPEAGLGRAVNDRLYKASEK